MSGKISIHVPRVGSDWASSMTKRPTFLFQSTFPGWGATRQARIPRRNQIYFNPRSPDGERRVTITADSLEAYFNPRSPDGERPELENSWLHMSRISIHAPRMGSDRRGSGSPSASVRFQSTLPGWGATVSVSRIRNADDVFQSTLPGWGATGCRSIGMVRW